MHHPNVRVFLLSIIPHKLLLMRVFKSTLLEDAQLALAKAIFFSSSAMSMVDNMHWRSAWKKIGEFGAGFTSPSYHVMRHSMLDKCTDLVKERVQRVILSNLSFTGLQLYAMVGQMYNVDH